MKRTMRILTTGWFCAILALSPQLALTAFAQDASDAAPADQVKTLRDLAQKGYLGDKKASALPDGALTGDDVTDALLKANDRISGVDLASLKPGDKAFQVQDLQALLTLVKQKAGAIRARKVSAWTFEKRLEKMITLLSVDTDETEEEPTPAQTAKAAAPEPTATATPVPGPSRADWDQMRGDLKDLRQKLADMEAGYQKKLDAVQTSNEDLRKANDSLRTSDSDQQEQLKLVKKLLDHVQSDLGKSSDRLEEVAKKAAEKNLTETEFQQDLMVMRKDIRDNSQDISVLKEEFAKIDRSGDEKNQSALDDLLGSKWVAGGALLVGVTALVVALTHK
ncbi:MAG TPA: hypothetical protein VHE12_07685 [bacterium]|nr:hypothetical protein [bacterium]